MRLKHFKQIALRCKDADDFYNMVRLIKDVPVSISDKFAEKYKNCDTPQEAAWAFFHDSYIESLNLNKVKEYLEITGWDYQYATPEREQEAQKAIDFLDGQKFSIPFIRKHITRDIMETAIEQHYHHKQNDLELYVAHVVAPNIAGSRIKRKFNVPESFVAHLIH